MVRTVKLQKGVELHFITKDKFAILLSENPYIDKVWTIKKEITECLNDLKKERFDLVIDLHKNLRSKRLILNLGSKSISFNKLNAQKWLRVHTSINILPKLHLIDRFFLALSKIGIQDDGHGMDFFYKLDGDGLNQKLKLQSDNPITIVLGATYLTKRVPDSIIDAVIDRFKEKTIILIGGKDVVQKGNEYKARYPKIINAISKFSIAESAAIMDKSACIITGDTGMMHIAAALNKPIVSVWGGTHHDLGMYPYYGKDQLDKNISIVNANINCSPCSKIGKDYCPKKHFKCLKELEIPQLLDAVQTQLNTTR